MYEIALGLDQPLIDLEDMVQLPRSQGVRAARRIYTASGTIHEENLYIELVWDVVTAGLYSAIMAQFNLDDNLTSEVTMALPAHDYIWRRYSGVALRPALGEDVERNILITNLTITVRDLRLAA